MDRIASAPDERAELFQETANRRDLAQPIIEKDFWVCWTLRKLFDAPETQPSLLFKGATSLSKVFRVINRFPEDIDLSLDRHDLGFRDERDPASAPSGKKAGKLLDELEGVAITYLRDTLVPHLRSKFAEVLEESPSWSLEVDRKRPLLVVFSYPAVPSTVDPPSSLYIEPAVRLEFGARSDHWPAQAYEIKPYAAEVFPSSFSDAVVSVNTWEAQRTFWEKATILHAEYHRKGKGRGNERRSRHYYDLAMLAGSEIRATALQSLDLLTAVAEHKRRFFRAAWANYEQARPGTLKLLPHGDLARELRADYRKMSEMFFDDPPDFDSLLATLSELEREINEPA